MYHILMHYYNKILLFYQDKLAAVVGGIQGDLSFGKEQGTDRMKGAGLVVGVAKRGAEQEQPSCYRRDSCHRMWHT